MRGTWPVIRRRPSRMCVPVHRQSLHACHDVPREEHRALLLFVQRALLVDRLDDVQVRRVYRRAVREAELRYELVPEDVHVGHHECGRSAALHAVRN